MIKIDNNNNNKSDLILRNKDESDAGDIPDVKSNRQEPSQVQNQVQAENHEQNDRKVIPDVCLLNDKIAKKFNGKMLVSELSKKKKEREINEATPKNAEQQKQNTGKPTKSPTSSFTKKTLTGSADTTPVSINNKNQSQNLPKNDNINEEIQFLNIQSQEVHKNSISGIKVLSNHVITTSLDFTVKLWKFNGRLISCEPIKTITLKNRITAITTYQTNDNSGEIPMESLTQEAYIGTSEGFIKRINFETFKIDKSFRPHKCQVNYIKIFKDSFANEKICLSISNDKVLKLYSLDQSKQVKPETIIHDDQLINESILTNKLITAFSICKKKPNRFYIGDSHGQLYLYEYQNLIEKTRSLYKFDEKLTSILEIDPGSLQCADSKGNVYSFSVYRESVLRIQVLGNKDGSVDDVGCNIKKMVYLDNLDCVLLCGDVIYVIFLFFKF